MFFIVQAAAFAGLTGCGSEPSVTTTMALRAREQVVVPVPVLTTAYSLESGTTLNFSLTVYGQNFVSGSSVLVGGSAVATTFVSPTELLASLTVTPSTTYVEVTVANPAPQAALSNELDVATPIVPTTTVTAAARLLDQATFGPTLQDISYVQQVGLNGYLDSQFSAPATLLVQPDSSVTIKELHHLVSGEWWQAALTGPDQLRQRVAMALSEIFVVSVDALNSYDARAVIAYHNMLSQDAFGNFGKLLKDVTLSPAMGEYLNMLNSAAPPPGQIANENYARELMQLFTTGLVQLNPDGSQVLDSQGNPLPTYTEAQVEAFARAYTGWTYANADGSAPTAFPNPTADYLDPMVAVESAHDGGEKTLLNGTVLPPLQTAEQDLDAALGNVFQHPNVGPFVCTQLIRHLVTSNPSPAYVQRIAAVFNDNGQGVRGDLQAAVRAILLDHKARLGDTNPTLDGGHLLEPTLYISGLMRGLGFSITSNQGYPSLVGAGQPLGEVPYDSPSVFNFYSAGYVLPGTAIPAPEFSLENTASSLNGSDFADTLISNGFYGISVDLSATSPLGTLAANPTDLVDALGVMFMHGQMPDNMRQTIIDHVTTLQDNAQRARVAAFLVVTSSQYKVMH